MFLSAVLLLLIYLKKFLSVLKDENKLNINNEVPILSRYKLFKLLSKLFTVILGTLILGINILY